MIYNAEQSCLLTNQSCWKKIRQYLDIDSGQQGKKIKYLITAVKVETRFVYFYGSNWQDLFYKLIACGTRSQCPMWIFFWYIKNLKLPSCLGKGTKISLKYAVLFIPRACPVFPKYALTRMAVAEPHFKDIF